MDEDAWRERRAALNPRPCIFEKAILARCAACGTAEHHALAERETVVCGDALAHARCRAFADCLRAAAGFAIGAPAADRPLAHRRKLKLWCGGLQGLRDTLGSAPGGDSVDRLLIEAEGRWGDFAALPYQDIVRAVAAWDPRDRSERG